MLISSVLADDLCYIDSEGTDFKKDLTSDMALFHACEYLINELEVVTFSTRLPKAMRQTEKVLVDGSNLLELSQPSSSSKLVSRIPRFFSLQSIPSLPKACFKTIFLNYKSFRLGFNLRVFYRHLVSHVELDPLIVVISRHIPTLALLKKQRVCSPMEVSNPVRQHS